MKGNKKEFEKYLVIRRLKHIDITNLKDTQYFCLTLEVFAVELGL